MSFFARVKRLLSSPDRGKAGWMIRSVSSLGVARIAAMVVPFITIPLALKHLDAERFGMWMAATAFMGVLSLADGGISNSLVTSVSVSSAKGDRDTIRSLVTNAIIVVGLVSLAMLPLGAAVAWGVDWRGVFSLKTPLAAAEAPMIVFLIITATALSLWVNVLVRLQYGLQRIVRASIWELVAIASSLPAFFLCLMLDFGTPALVASLALLPAIIRGIGGWTFLRHQPDLYPNRALLSRSVQRSLFASGSMYMLLEIAIVLSVTSDQFFVAALVSADAVASFTVFYRLYSLPLVLVGLVYQTQWPVYARAAARGEYRWLRRSFFISMALVSMFAIVAALLLSTLHPVIIRLWLGRSLAPSAYLVPSMAGYTILSILEYGGRSLLYSLDRRRALMSCSAAMAVVNISLKLYLLPRIGAAGAMIATDIAFTLCMVAPYMWLASRLYHPRRGSHNAPETRR